MAYTVLARKYRPQTFVDLVGQEHVTRTLGNAIETGRVAHAFLFTGVRGVGKTTMARLLAKALNCEKGPTPEPCGECERCTGITAGRDSDVQEMDGASNNSVEDVRRLQESIPYRPQNSRFKVVIVDEVHMLSTGAFNAFLKTLEEPPDHVKFILATTEAHKVPVTIRSRCQRYDFRLIPQQLVSERVREILRAESIQADDEAVAIVAREAAGSMRDALTLLDQIVAFGGEHLLGADVARVLGIADRELVHGIAESMVGGDGAKVLTLVDELASRGLDMVHFSRQLLELVRDMVVLRVAGEGTGLVAMVPEERARAAATAKSVHVEELQRAFSALSRVVEDVSQSGSPRTTLEMGLVRLASRPPLLPLAELVARFEALERRGRGGGSQQRGGGGGGGQTARAPEGAAAGRELVSKLKTEAEVPEAAPAPAPVPEAADVPAPVPVPVPEPPTSLGRKAAPAPAPVSEAPPVPVPVPVPVPDPVPVPEADPTPTPEYGTPWEAIVARVEEKKPAVGAVLHHASPVEVSARTIALAFPTGSFAGRQVQSPESIALIAEAAAAVLGGTPTIEIVESDGAGAQTMVEAAKQKRDELEAELRERALNHPIVTETASLFSLPRDAMTVHVELE